MNNEPVEWNSQNTFCSKCHRIPSQCCCSSVKELTKEEISDIRDKYLSPQDCDIYTFARAILRKAQEK